jgi:phage shock protein PspC (stress-responsive transcriptional regulator)
MDLVEFVKGLIGIVVIIAWFIFLLAWVIGWLIKGLPIPFLRVKKLGGRFVEDAIWAAFWLAMGTTVFAIVAYIVSSIQLPMPQPPTMP